MHVSSPGKNRPGDLRAAQPTDGKMPKGGKTVNEQTKALETKARVIVSEMTLRQKAYILYGRDFWYVRGSLAQEDLFDIMLTDRPSGLRKQTGKADMLGIHESIPATAFPTASCIACLEADKVRIPASASGIAGRTCVVDMKHTGGNQARPLSCRKGPFRRSEKIQKNFQKKC